MTGNMMGLCALAAGMALSGCSAERWAERDAQVRCERMMDEVLADVEVERPEPTVAPVGDDDGLVVTWARVRIGAADHGAAAPREVTAVCRFGLQGDVEWIEIDGERVFAPATRGDAVRAQRDTAADGADDDTVR